MRLRLPELLLHPHMSQLCYACHAQSHLLGYLIHHILILDPCQHQIRSRFVTHTLDCELSLWFLEEDFVHAKTLLGTQSRQRYESLDGHLLAVLA